jgi:aryl-alcohol dehydrogenase-like predicted oxidoreductase
MTETSARNRSENRPVLVSFARMSAVSLSSAQNVSETALSRIGLGSWVFGRVAWAPQEDDDSVAAILRAVERGVNWIDTGAVYGGGHAERIVGRALAQLSPQERPLVFTKAGIRIDAVGDTYRDLSPESVREECEASLRRLGVQRIDLYQLHWPVDDHAVVEAAWETLGELQREGKIRWAGVSNFEPELLRRCAALRRIESVQPPLSLVNRDATTEVIPWATREGALAIVYSPLGSGLLSGRFSLERLQALPPEDWRRRRAPFQAPQLQRTLDLVERLRPLASELEVSIAELAIAWTLAWPGVNGTIAGARSPAQLDEWIGAAELQLDAQALDVISVALTQTHAGSGPTHPAAAQAAFTARP